MHRDEISHSPTKRCKSWLSLCWSRTSLQWLQCETSWKMETWRSRTGRRRQVLQKVPLAAPEASCKKLQMYHAHRCPRAGQDPGSGQRSQPCPCPGAYRSWWWAAPYTSLNIYLQGSTWELLQTGISWKSLCWKLYWSKGVWPFIHLSTSGTAGAVITLQLHGLKTCKGGYFKCKTVKWNLIPP